MPTNLLLVLIAIVIGGAALVVFARLLRKARRDTAESKAESKKLAERLGRINDAKTDLDWLKTKLANERASPVPDLTLIRTYERTLRDLEREYEREVTPWGPVERS